MLAKADAGDPAATLHFRRSRIGPNAFALPGGDIVITADLLALAEKDQSAAESMVRGGLAHEYGHLLHRHGVRHLVSVFLLNIATGALWGDYSDAFAMTPVIVGQTGYSRNAEREADTESAHLLRAAAISSLGMGKFFAAVDAHFREEEVRESL